jgi:hypothetical protein
LAPVSPTQYAIIGNRTISRSTDFTTGGDFFANTINDELDQQTIFAQQNAEAIQRSLTAPQTDPTTVDMTLPRASVRANKTLAFDANGDPTTGEVIGDNRGNWAAAVAYNKRDVVKDTSNGNIYYANTSHTSTGSQPISSNADVAKWDLLVDNASSAASATAAASSASAASTSASNASSSASAASTSASNASTSASTASTQASNAATSATAASGSATSAANSAAAAASALDSFDDRYLGTKSSDPTVDNDGNALATGALYFSTTANVMKVYDGSSWIAATSAGATSLLRFRYVATSGQTTFTGADAASATLSYTVNNIAVHRNGVTLDTSEYTASSGTSVVLNVAAGTGDIIDIIAFKSFTVSDALSAISGGTVNGAVTITGVTTVQAGSASLPAITATGDTNTGIFFPAADTIAFAEGGAEAMRISSAGNVGIGTTSPSDTSSYGRALDIQSSTGAAIYLRDSDGPTTDYGLVAYDSSIDSLTLGSVTASTGIMRLLTAGSERARIKSDGSLLVAKTDSNLSSVGTFVLTDGRINVVTASTTTAFSTYELYSTGVGTYRFYVTANGSVNATNTAITALSDQRLKENIRDLNVGLDKIMALKPRLYDWKEGKGADIKNARGFIAQEFETVFPDLIDTWKDPAPEGEEPYKSVRADLFPVLVKAMQEQQALIETLTQRITALEGA